MQSRNTAMLAAIHYEAGFQLDEFMLAVAKALQVDDIRTGGTIQENAGDASCSSMSLVNLATGERFGISQDLGHAANGCRLDPRGLAALAAQFDAAMNEDLDLLIVNKFGKAEAEGSGLVSAVARAFIAGIPVLTAVRPPYDVAWTRFHAGLAVDLAPRSELVLAWCRRAVMNRRVTRSAESPSATPPP